MNKDYGSPTWFNANVTMLQASSCVSSQGLDYRPILCVLLFWNPILCKCKSRTGIRRDSIPIPLFLNFRWVLSGFCVKCYTPIKSYWLPPFRAQDGAFEDPYFNRVNGGNVLSKSHSLIETKKCRSWFPHVNSQSFDYTSYTNIECIMSNTFLKITGVRRGLTKRQIF